MKKTTSMKLALSVYPEGTMTDAILAKQLALRIDSAIRRAVLAERKACINDAARHPDGKRWAVAIEMDAQSRDAKGRKRGK